MNELDSMSRAGLYPKNKPRRHRESLQYKVYLEPLYQAERIGAQTAQSLSYSFRGLCYR